MIYLPRAFFLFVSVLVLCGRTEGADPFQEHAEKLKLELKNLKSQMEEVVPLVRRDLHILKLSKDTNFGFVGVFGAISATFSMLSIYLGGDIHYTFAAISAASMTGFSVLGFTNWIRRDLELTKRNRLWPQRSQDLTEYAKLSDARISEGLSELEIARATEDSGLRLEKIYHILCKQLKILSDEPDLSISDEDFKKLKIYLKLNILLKKIFYKTAELHLTVAAHRAMNTSDSLRSTDCVAVLSMVSSHWVDLKE